LKNPGPMKPPWDPMDPKRDYGTPPGRKPGKISKMFGPLWGPWDLKRPYRDHQGLMVTSLLNIGDPMKPQYARGATRAARGTYGNLGLNSSFAKLHHLLRIENCMSQDGFTWFLFICSLPNSRRYLIHPPRHPPLRGRRHHAATPVQYH